jgi:hypothetical protein
LARLSAPREISVKTGSIARFVVTASDSGSTPLAVSASNLPVSATFDPAAGTLDWQPAVTDTGSHQIAFTAISGAG